MFALRSHARSALVHALTREIPLARVRHNERPVYLAEGYGGRPITDFPPHEFFRLFVAGAREEAFAGFSAWYQQQFGRHGCQPKRRGGMRGGTLHRLLAEVCREAGAALPEDPRAADPALLEEAIRRRVGQRFAMLQSIQERGYRAELGKPVLGIRRSGDIVLLGGHHRAAALSVLGHATLPAVAVFPQRAFFRMAKRVRLV